MWRRIRRKSDLFFFSHVSWSWCRKALNDCHLAKDRKERMGEKIEKKRMGSIYRYIYCQVTRLRRAKIDGKQLPDWINWINRLPRTDEAALVRDPRRYCWDFRENFGNLWRLKSFGQFVVTFIIIHLTSSMFCIIWLIKYQIYK